jgi:hypothetical protein
MSGVIAFLIADGVIFGHSPLSVYAIHGAPLDSSFSARFIAIIFWIKRGGAWMRIMCLLAEGISLHFLISFCAI